MDSKSPRLTILWSGLAVLPIASAILGAASNDSGTEWALAGSAVAAAMACAGIGWGLVGLMRVATQGPGPQSTALVAEPPTLPGVVLESRLEFAPIAMFRIAGDGAHGRLEALNASARRLLAAGRVNDVAALADSLRSIPSGQRRLIEFDSDRGRERALASVSVLTVAGLPERLLALMPMEDQLEAEAMQAWQKLVNVLTHEIMNSLTPVVSLSGTARELVQEAADGLAPELVRDLDLSMDAIARRADSLIRFVSGYRALASVPDARPQRIAVKDLFARLNALSGAHWQRRGGQAQFEVEPATVELMADTGQLEQALLNLIQNAAEATAEVGSPSVRVHARLTRGGSLRIEVRDNGPGVPDALVAGLFTPFFSTKSKNRGVGLALVRQLIHRNGGSVRYAKSVGAGARFVITF